MTLPSNTGTAPEPSETNPLGVEPDTGTDGGRDGRERVHPDDGARGDDGQPPVAEDPGPQS